MENEAGSEYSRKLGCYFRLVLTHRYISAPTNRYTHPRPLLASPRSPQVLPLALRRVRETAMTSPVSSTFTTSPSSPCPTISREEIAKIVAARRTPQRRIVVPDTDEWVEARREPLGRLAVGIRAKFEGPKVGCTTCRPHLGRRTDTCYSLAGRRYSGGISFIPIMARECSSRV